MDDRSLIEERNLKKKKRRRKRIIIFLVVVAVIAAILPFILTREVETVVVGPVEREATVVSNTYTQVIDLSGYVEPYDSQIMRFRTTGAVTGVYVDEGDYVKEGQLLASIDSTQQQAALQEILNQIEEAELSGSRRELELLKLRQASAEANLEYADIVAPFDGEIASVDVAEGDYFEGGDEVITVVDRSKLKATVEIDEMASLVFEARPDASVEAYVSYLPMLGRYTDQGIGVADVEFLIENPPEGIMPGFTFEGTLEAEGDVTMLLIPQAAITRGRGGSQSVTVKRPDGTREVVEIRTEYLGEGLAELLSGDLQEGDTLVYESRSQLGGLVP